MNEKAKVLTVSFKVTDVMYGEIAPYIVREKPLTVLIPVQDGIDKQLEMEVNCIEENVDGNSIEFKVYPIFIRQEGGDAKHTMESIYAETGINGYR